MKFETPIAEVELFDLKDMISASGESNPTEPSDTNETTDDTTDYDTAAEGNCIYHDKRDNDNWFECF